MRIRIASVGKLKAGYLQDAAVEYTRRLSRYASIECCEVADEPAPEHLSTAQKNMVLAREGERLLKLVQERDIVVALCIDGQTFDSNAFSRQLDVWLEKGGAFVTFLIGGSLGLSPEVLQRANYTLSLSGMTFPHQLARILLLEQLYRAFKIHNNEPYHK